MISVAITTYNAEKFIIRQLNSWMKQTIKPDEVIIADDGSTDSTVQLVGQFIIDNRLANWSIYKNEKNLGWKKNFINVISKCSGDFIFISDQDDYCHPQKVERMLSAFWNDGTIDLLACKYQKFYDEDLNRKIHIYKGNPRVSKINGKSDIFYVKYPGCTYCIKKQFACEAFQYWDNRTSHDGILWYISGLKGSRRLLNEELHYWYKHRDSAYAKESVALKSIKNKICDNDDRLDILHNLELYCNDYLNTDKRAIRLVRRNICWCKLRKNFLEVKKIGDGLKLIKYLTCYPRLRQYLYDWYLVLRK